MWLQLFVELWFYNTGVCVDNIKFFVQLDCTDFYDFERQTAVEPAFTVLIPAESGHNHTLLLNDYPE